MKKIKKGTKQLLEEESCCGGRGGKLSSEHKSEHGKQKPKNCCGGCSS